MDFEFEIIDPMELADRLNKALEFAGIKPAQIADIVGQTQANMSHYLNGRNKQISPLIARKIAEVCGVRLMWLVYGDEPMLPTNADRLTEAAQGLTDDQVEMLAKLAEQLKNR